MRQSYHKTKTLVFEEEFVSVSIRFRRRPRPKCRKCDRRVDAEDFDIVFTVHEDRGTAAGLRFMDCRDCRRPERPEDIYDLTRRPETWAVMDRAAKAMYRTEVRRLKDEIQQLRWGVD